MKLTRPLRHTMFFGVAALCAAICCAATDASFFDRERAKEIAARHLLGLIDSPQLSTVVRQKKLEDDAYWLAVFKRAGQPALYGLVEKDLKRALAEVPLIDGAPAKPAAVANVALHGLSPLPFVTVSALPETEQRRVIAFASGALKRFSSTIYSSSRDFDAAVADVALDAGSAFHSSLISEGFNRLGTLSSDVRLHENEAELMDAKDRLNELLHLWGMHLVLNSDALVQGKLTLSAYLIVRSHQYEVERVVFPMYEVQPIVEQEYYPALGHAEVEQGFLILFAQTINEEVDSTARYLASEDMSFVKPTAALSSATVRTVNALVRDGVSDPSRLRERFIDSVGHHEGFHKYIEPTLAESVRRGYFSETEKSVFHEAGAYLYQLETSDPQFTPLDLALVLATSQNASGDYYANGGGAAQALRRLGEALGSGGDVISLFKARPSAIKKAAGQARLQYEVDVRNGRR